MLGRFFGNRVNFTHFGTFVEQADDSDEISLMRRPEELVFDEMPTRPSGHFSLLMTVGEDTRLGVGRLSRD